MQLKFTKMHGLGNDFVVIDAINQTVSLSEADFRLLADRKHGVGCDQILLVEPAQSQVAQFRYRIINADGSEVAQCGNGARCFARFVRDKGLTQQSEIVVETNAGVLVLTAHDDHTVTVDMGVPQFSPQAIPITAELEQMNYSLDDADGQAVEFAVANIGNPHAVIQVPDVNTAPLESIGPWLERHPFFPERVNVGFMQVISRNEFTLRVFERGVGETRACGSGACAAMAVGVESGLLDHTARAHLIGGELSLQYAGLGNAVLMTGPTASVFEGTIEL